MSGLGSLSGAPSLGKPSSGSSGGQASLTGGLVPLDEKKPKAGAGRMADLDALLDMIDDDKTSKPKASSSKIKSKGKAGGSSKGSKKASSKKSSSAKTKSSGGHKSDEDVMVSSDDLGDVDIVEDAPIPKANRFGVNTISGSSRTFVNKQSSSSSSSSSSFSSSSSSFLSLSVCGITSCD